MSELGERLQELADSAALVARTPEPAVIARRGRRRRRRVRVGGVALLALVVAAGTGGLSLWTQRTAVVAPAAPTQPVCTSAVPGPTVSVPGRVPQVRVCRGGSPPGMPSFKGGVVVASGTHDGIAWRVVAVLTAKKVCWGLRDSNDDPDNVVHGLGCTSTPVHALGWGEESPWAGGRAAAREKRVLGVAGPDTARVRLTLKRGTSLNLDTPTLPPVNAQVIDGGRVAPVRFFLAFLPGDRSVAQAESFTASGVSTCRVLGDDFKTPKLPMGCTNEPIPGG
jgi:hypothetical protein